MNFRLGIIISGLDAFTARHVTETLKALSRLGRTIIMSIHQPRYDVFALFDDVVLLSRGELIFSGTAEGVIKHFCSLGYACPDLVNPADFILDITSVDVSFRSLFISRCLQDFYYNYLFCLIMYV